MQELCALSSVQDPSLNLPNLCWCQEIQRRVRESCIPRRILDECTAEFGLVYLSPSLRLHPFPCVANRHIHRSLRILNMVPPCNIVLEEVFPTRPLPRATSPAFARIGPAPLSPKRGGNHCVTEATGQFLGRFPQFLGNS